MWDYSESIECGVGARACSWRRIKENRYDRNNARQQPATISCMKTSRSSCRKNVKWKFQRHQIEKLRKKNCSLASVCFDIWAFFIQMRDAMAIMNRDANTYIRVKPKWRYRPTHKYNRRRGYQIDNRQCLFRWATCPLGNRCGEM